MSRQPVSQRQSATRRGKTPATHDKRVYWSDAVTRTSNALDLEPGVFTWEEPERIARSLLRSAEASTRRKGTPYQSAISMLSFYINRAGSSLPAERRRVLQQAKDVLRRLRERG